jgi:hypothetical protein
MISQQHSYSQELANIITQSLPKFTQITEEAWSHKPFPTQWSKREILGHLIDSAQNNLRRFVVTQYQQNDTIVYYQDEWVAYQNYQQMPTLDVIDLWRLLNLHICRIIDNIPAKKLQNTCNTGKETEELHTLEFLISDYIAHLNHHLVQIQNS